MSERLERKKQLGRCVKEIKKDGNGTKERVVRDAKRRIGDEKAAFGRRTGKKKNLSNSRLQHIRIIRVVCRTSLASGDSDVARPKLERNAEGRGEATRSRHYGHCLVFQTTSPGMSFKEKNPEPLCIGSVGDILLLLLFLFCSLLGNRETKKKTKKKQIPLSSRRALIPLSPARRGARTF